MNGQLSIFDLPKKKPRPCDYRWQRYIGQKVELRCGIKGKIIEIEPYYTIVKDASGKEYVGTPSDCWPMEKDYGFL